MKSIAAVVLALATIKGSLAQSVSLPTCGATCMVSSVSVTTCAASDFVCLCTNSAYINLAIHCINSSCSATDAQNSYAYATFACNSVGVQVPSVDSVLNPSGSASSAAPAPAAATSASDPAPAADPTTAAAAGTTASAAPKASSASNSTVSSSGSKPHTSALVTFQGSAPNVVGIEKGIVAAVAVGVVAVLGIGLL